MAGLFLENRFSVDDVKTMRQTVPVALHAHLDALKAVDGFSIPCMVPRRIGHLLDAGSDGCDRAEGEIGGLIVLGRRRILQILACANVLQRPALAFHILGIPHRPVGYLVASLVVQTLDEAVVARNIL